MVGDKWEVGLTVRRVEQRAVAFGCGIDEREDKG